MQIDNQPILLYCFRGNRAVFACAKLQCFKNSLMCSSDTCACRQPHEECLTAPQISNILRRLERKAESYLPVYDLIEKWGEKQEKLIKKQMDYLKKVIDDKLYFLTGKEEELYKKIIEGRSSDISSDLVHYAIEAIHRQPQFTIGPIMMSLERYLENSSKQFEKTVEDIIKALRSKFNYLPSLSLARFQPSTVSISTSTDLRFPPSAAETTLNQVKFSQSLHHSFLSLSTDQHKIKVNKQNGNWYAALLQPSIFRRDPKICVFRFRINKVNNSCLMFGVCQVSPNFRITDNNIYNSIQYGSFTYIGSNSVWLGNSSGHQEEGSNMGEYESEDIVEIIYFRDREKVIVRNITKREESISYIKTDQNFALYAGVIMYDRDDEVEIIEVIETD